MTHTVLSNHIETLANGRMVEPGEQIAKLDTKHPHNKQLLERGAIAADPPKGKTAAKSSQKED